MKAVEPVGGIRRMPVIEKIVMEQRAAYQTRFIAAKVESAHQIQAEIGHSNAVEQYGSIAVLDIFPALGQPGQLQQREQLPIQEFEDSEISQNSMPPVRCRYSSTQFREVQGQRRGFHKRLKIIVENR